MQPTPDRDISPPNSRSGAPIYEQSTGTAAGARSRTPATSSRGWGRSEFLMFYHDFLRDGVVAFRTRATLCPPMGARFSRVRVPEAVIFSGCSGCATPNETYRGSVRMRPYAPSYNGLGLGGHTRNAPRFPPCRSLNSGFSACPPFPPRGGTAQNGRRWSG